MQNYLNHFMDDWEDRKDRKMYSDEHNSTISWLQDYEMRQSEISREDLMLEIRWLQHQEQKAKEKNGNN